MQRLWLAFVGVMVFSFLILGWIGTRIYQELELESGSLLYLNANEPHSVRAVEDSSLLLTILLPQK